MQFLPLCEISLNTLMSPAIENHLFPNKTCQSTLNVVLIQLIIWTSILHQMISWGVPRIWEGGWQEFFFSDLGICMSRSDMLRMAKPCALLGGFGGMLLREIFLKRCDLVRFRVYFDQILSLFLFKKYHFLYKK